MDICSCESEDDPEYPALQMTFLGGHEIPVKQSWYLRYHSDSILGFKYCRFLIKPSTETMFWTLGNAFLTTHTSIFDFDEGKIGFVENPFVRVIESTPEVVTDNTYVIIMIIFLSVFIAACCGVIIWRASLCKKPTNGLERKVEGETLETEMNMVEKPGKPIETDIRHVNEISEGHAGEKDPESLERSQKQTERYPSP